MKSQTATAWFVTMLALITVGSTSGADGPPNVRVLQDHGGSVMSVSFSPDQVKLASSSRDGTIKIWDIATGKLDRTLTEHTDDVYCVAYSPDGALLASCSGDKSIRIWDARTFKVVRVINGHAEVVRWVCFSGDGKTLASASGDLTIRVWDVQTGNQLKSLSGHTSVIKMVRFSPDGKALASCSADATVRTWNIETGRQTAMFSGHTSSIECISGSAEGALYASSSNDGSVRLWNAHTGEPFQLLLGHVSEVDSVALTSDGKTVISGGKDKTIRFWDVPSAQVIHTLTGHTGRVESLELSPDGKMLATGGGGGDTSVRLWVIAMSQMVRRAPAAPPQAPVSDRGASIPPTAAFNAAEIDQLWRLLGNDDGDDVGVALNRLILGGDAAVAALAARLAPTVQPPTPDRIKQWIADLNSADPAVRERATCDLIQSGPSIEEPVREALKQPQSPLVRHRLEMALRDVTTKEPGQTQSAAQLLRESNCIQALRTINTPAAAKLLSARFPQAAATQNAPGR